MSEFPPSSLRPLIEEVFELLKSRNETISVAETVRSLEVVTGSYIDFMQAAGGLISACLLVSPGASAIYKGGVTVLCYPTFSPNHINSL
jgi:nicotinamide mononucleotide (NMN) deamidase PncC